MLSTLQPPENRSDRTIWRKILNYLKQFAFERNVLNPEWIYGGKGIVFLGQTFYLQNLNPSCANQNMSQAHIAIIRFRSHLNVKVYYTHRVCFYRCAQCWARTKPIDKLYNNNWLGNRTVLSVRAIRTWAVIAAYKQSASCTAHTSFEPRDHSTIKNWAWKNVYDYEWFVDEIVCSSCDLIMVLPFTSSFTTSGFLFNWCYFAQLIGHTDVADNARPSRMYVC